MNRTVTALAITLLMTLASGESFAAGKKRSDFTKAQQKAFFQEALKACRKKYGSRLHDVKVDYSKGKYVCWFYD
jgi:hypothetical protein